ncbi:MAG: hypothetical protein HN475_04755 [Piscirickettsiaceae bacterium]|nr:hypothetical protein [Piscirickettsiaceae bacterium]
MKINTAPKLLLALLIGLIISVLLGRHIYSNETRFISTEFEQDVRTESLALEREIALNFYALQSLKNFFDNSQHVDSEEFKHYASSLLETHPDISALSWVPKINESERSRYETEQVYFGKKLQIIERNESQKLIPALKRHLYFPVTYIEPLVDNEDALGMISILIQTV